MNHAYVNWDGQCIKLTWIPNYQAKIELVTSVHGYCFLDGKIMLVHIKNRGFNMPGGHIEVNETPEETFHREAYEEGYVKGNIQYLGALEVNHTENTLFDVNGKYPIIGYQLFYRMDITECLSFLREHESIARIWIEPDQVPFVMENHPLALAILENALKAVSI
ncbi:NUDIX domain-containing protein [Bacillus sp. FJAT-49736]|uniref:NUDIX hydrolase n=1 Tax=Bacillus sp. FJAT-49736 TaxID=2833582 RepID=UPI001BCA5E01|nr:NUDIX domain-containing protein [Bacillus sp. FJAT-49736]MBS4172959.1 NUDIX domain-containing protein [Bacillus sp. FJAT-49736]